jgi:hypothetical protein
LISCQSEDRESNDFLVNQVRVKIANLSIVHSLNDDGPAPLCC